MSTFTTSRVFDASAKLAVLGITFALSSATLAVSTLHAEPVTWAVQGTIDAVVNYQDVERAPGPIVEPPLAVDPTSIPFAVGDQVRALFTYESDLPFSTDSPCAGSALTVQEAGTIVNGTITTTGVLGTIRADRIKITDCFQSGDFAGTMAFAGPVDGSKIEDLTLRDFFFEYDTSNPDCFVNPIALPTAALDPATCPMSVTSYAMLSWVHVDSRRYVTIAIKTLSVERPTSQVATEPGSDVIVRPVAVLSGETYPIEAELRFDEILSPGTTSVVASTSPDGGVPTSPPHFKVGDPAVYYDVDTTATFSGNVGLCFSWQEGQFNDENAVALYHFDGVDWQPVTVSVDPLMNKVCGQSSSLSPFALFERSLTFTGFLGPVDNLPTRNIANAGATIPLKFSLNGNQGLNVLAEGYPKSQVITCATGAPTDVIEETLTAGNSGISYNASVDQYTYAWKTNKAWAKSCSRLMFRLTDGSEYSAEFGFK